MHRQAKEFSEALKNFEAKPSCRIYTSAEAPRVWHIRESGLGATARVPGEPITWSYSSATLEQGLGATFYTLTGLPHGAVVEAQAEFIEIQDRSRSCQATV